MENKINNNSAGVEEKNASFAEILLTILDEQGNKVKVHFDCSLPSSGPWLCKNKQTGTESSIDNTTV